MKKQYYELMILMKRDSGDLLFESISELNEEVSRINIDSESEGFNHALGIIRTLLKEDESVKNKYKLVKK